MVTVQGQTQPAVRLDRRGQFRLLQTSRVAVLAGDGGTRVPVVGQQVAGILSSPPLMHRVRPLPRHKLSMDAVVANSSRPLQRERERPVKVRTTLTAGRIPLPILLFPLSSTVLWVQIASAVLLAYTTLAQPVLYPADPL